jgi:hypothetical protein
MSAPAAEPQISRKLTPTHLRMFRRRAEMVRLAEHRRTYNVALFNPDGWALAMADVLAFGRDELDYPSFLRLASSLNVAIDEKIVMVAIHKVARLVEIKGVAYRPLAGPTVAKLLDVTTEERLLLDIRTIAAVDETPEQSKDRLTEDRRTRDRERKRRARAADGAVQRPQYEATTITKAQPWAALGMSRRTWYRKGKPSPEVKPLSTREGVAVAQVRPLTIYKKEGGRTCATGATAPGTTLTLAEFEHKCRLDGILPIMPSPAAIRRGQRSAQAESPTRQRHA